MPVTRITPATLLSFPIGMPVRFFYGCPVSTGEAFGVQEEEGLVVGYHADRWGVALVAETASGREHRITCFVTAGVGAYRED
ncbi:hypothetical protein [Rhodosalinus sediminis]|uniref:hypothetical protein n=1 Tax=Rhodosalinus sediminis TaxID=1940533 RepID=UPI0023542048|nr:hypothetical protein [Rhodosalinus sediminis]